MRRRVYGLTVDRREAAALERILAGCESTALEPRGVHCVGRRRALGACSPHLRSPATMRSRSTTTIGTAAITCAEARRHGIAPVPRSHPAYRYMRDGDGDGVVCE